MSTYLGQRFLSFVGQGSDIATQKAGVFLIQQRLMLCLMLPLSLAMGATAFFGLMPELGAVWAGVIVSSLYALGLCFLGFSISRSYKKYR